jgi:hypothetical protein
MSQATTQNTTVTASGRTGEICQKTGPYRCTTSPVVVITMKKGGTFPPGPSNTPPNTQPTTWNYVTITTSTITTI